MSGHSKWSTIKRQKGVTDAKRGNLFTKLGNSIAIAVREGGSGDPNFNFKLRLAVEKAREANMPKENIARAIDKGLGKAGGGELVEAIFEGFGPPAGGGNVAVIVETVTDNTTRTAAELKNVFEKNGGRLAGPGAVAYMFNRVGEVETDKIKDQGYWTMDEILDKAIEAGAQDVEENPESFSVFTRAEDLHKVKDKLQLEGLNLLNSSIVYRPNKETLVSVSDKRKLEEFLDAVDDLDDAQEVYLNI